MGVRLSSGELSRVRRGTHSSHIRDGHVRPRRLSWQRARTHRHACARRHRPASGRGRGAHPGRASRRSRSSALPIARARRRRRASARAWPPPSSAGQAPRITINLAPAALRKEGSGFDLPIALALLAASYQVPSRSLDGHAAFGELGLDGRLRPVPGALVAAEGARRAGLTHLVCAAESAPEVALAGVEPVGVRHLGEAVSYLRGEHEPPEPPPPDDDFEALAGVPDLADVRGQERARRALEIAAAGGHNLLLAGPPGTGKTMLARRLPGLLPLLDDDAALEVTRIHSVSGTLAPGAGLVARAAVPRAAPLELGGGVIGGGAGSPRPGEVSLAHRRRALPRRAARVPAAGARGAAPAARGRRRLGRAGRGRGRLPGALPARRRDEPVPVRRAGRPAARCSCTPRARPALSREALAGAARSLRPRRSPCRGRGRVELAGRRGEASAPVRDAGARRARGGCASGRPSGRAAADELLDARGRAAAALGPRSRARRARRGDDRRARRCRRGRARARRRGARRTARRGS